MQSMLKSLLTTKDIKKTVNEYKIIKNEINDELIVSCLESRYYVHRIALCYILFPNNNSNKTTINAINHLFRDPIQLIPRTLLESMALSKDVTILPFSLLFDMLEYLKGKNDYMMCGSVDIFVLLCRKIYGYDSSGVENKLRNKKERANTRHHKKESAIHHRKENEITIKYLHFFLKTNSWRVRLSFAKKLNQLMPFYDEIVNSIINENENDFLILAMLKNLKNVNLMRLLELDENVRVGVVVEIGERIRNGDFNFDEFDDGKENPSNSDNNKKKSLIKDTSRLVRFEVLKILKCKELIFEFSSSEDWRERMKALEIMLMEYGDLLSYEDMNDTNNFRDLFFLCLKDSVALVRNYASKNFKIENILKIEDKMKFICRLKKEINEYSDNYLYKVSVVSLVVNCYFKMGYVSVEDYSCEDQDVNYSFNHSISPSIGQSMDKDSSQSMDNTINISMDKPMSQQMENIHSQQEFYSQQPGNSSDDEIRKECHDILSDILKGLSEDLVKNVREKVYRKL